MHILTIIHTKAEGKPIIRNSWWDRAKASQSILWYLLSLSTLKKNINHCDWSKLLLFWKVNHKLNNIDWELIRSFIWLASHQLWCIVCSVEVQAVKLYFCLKLWNCRLGQWKARRLRYSSWSYATFSIKMSFLGLIQGVFWLQNGKNDGFTKMSVESWKLYIVELRGQSFGKWMEKNSKGFEQ